MTRPTWSGKEYRRWQAHSNPFEKRQSLLTSAATVQGFKARIFSGNSLPDRGGEGKAARTRCHSKRSCVIEMGVANSGGPRNAMIVKKKDSRERNARRWAAGLMKSVRAVLAERPEADPDNVRHTLILLEQPPLERLRKSLTRGRALAQPK